MVSILTPFSKTKFPKKSAFRRFYIYDLLFILPCFLGSRAKLIKILGFTIITVPDWTFLRYFQLSDLTIKIVRLLERQTVLDAQLAMTSHLLRSPIQTRLIFLRCIARRLGTRHHNSCYLICCTNNVDLVKKFKET